MNKQTLIIKGRFPSLNDYVSKERTNRFVAAKMKREETERVWWSCSQLKPVKEPVAIHFRWYEPNRRRDIDNIRFGAKFILDGLVNAEIISDDSQRYVKRLSDEVLIDKDNPRVEVDIQCI